MSNLRTCPDDSDDSEFAWDGFCSHVPRLVFVVQSIEMPGWSLVAQSEQC